MLGINSSLTPSINAKEISEKEFYSSITDDHIVILDLGYAAIHSDGSTALYESTHGKYAIISH